ncbi:MAG TPA: dihydroneopterin aldolase, partial [Thermodesulfobacteriota bacterium]
MDRVIVKGLVVEASVGVSDAERAAPQRCRVDVELTADLEAAGTSDDLAKTIHYGHVIETLREVAATQTTRLVEALAGRMVDALFERFGPERITQPPQPGRAIAVKLRLVKLDPPIDAPVDEVGVELERTAAPRRPAGAGPLG